MPYNSAMHSDLKVLLVSTDDDRRSRWAAALRLAGVFVSDNSNSVIDERVWDVVVTDTKLDTLGAVTQHIDQGETGVIAVEIERAADAWLPADPADRELVQVCRLVGEIIRLRRQQRGADRTRQALTELAYTDALTGIPNRRAWDETWRDRIESAAGGQRAICLALIDLDHFKQVNEQQGHAVGDKILRLTGDSLKGTIRNRDLAVRLGGDEFALLLDGLELAHARHVVDRARRNVCSALTECGVTASAGLAVMNAGNPRLPDELFQRADESLRRAKATGRDQTVIEECT